METLIEVIIPTFVNPHLFWIIETKNLLLRSAMANCLSKIEQKSVLGYDEYYENEQVAVKIDQTWCRALVEQILEPELNESRQYVCWLLDYGVMRVTNTVFDLPECLKKCPFLAKQSSLHNVVNLYARYEVDEVDLKVVYDRTTGYVEGVRNVALTRIDESCKTFFSVVDEDDYNFYGDVVCLSKKGVQQSLTECLIERGLLARDEAMFAGMDNSRMQLREDYFQNKQKWQKEIDRTEKMNRNEVIYNEEENKTCYMEYFKRKTVELDSAIDDF